MFGAYAIRPQLLYIRILRNGYRAIPRHHHRIASRYATVAHTRQTQEREIDKTSECDGIFNSIVTFVSGNVLVYIAFADSGWCPKMVKPPSDSIEYLRGSICCV